MIINLNKYLDEKLSVLVNFDKGKELSEKLKLFNKLSIYGKLEIVIPKNVFYISESFMQGLLYDIVAKYKYNTYDIVKFINSNDNIEHNYLNILSRNYNIKKDEEKYNNFIKKSLYFFYKKYENWKKL
jgi:hypothetical protein